METFKNQDALAPRINEVFPIRIANPGTDHEVWQEMLAYAEEQFGPDASNELWIKGQSFCSFTFDPNARWTWINHGDVHFKTIAEATLFKLRWC